MLNEICSVLGCKYLHRRNKTYLQHIKRRSNTHFKPLLALHNETYIDHPSHYSNIADVMTSTLSKLSELSIDELIYFGQLPPCEKWEVLEHKLNLTREDIRYRFGCTVDLSVVAIKTMITPSNDIARCIYEEVLPVMHGKLGMTKVRSTTLDVRKLNSVDKLFKMHYILNKQDAEFDKAKKLFEEDRYYRGSNLSGGQFVYSMLESLTRIGEIAATIPLRRFTQSWQFYRDCADQQPPETKLGPSSIALVGGSSRISYRPLTKSDAYLFFAQHSDDEVFVSEWLNSGVWCINQFFNFLLSLENFVDESNGNELDSGLFLCVVAAINLIFGDLHKINAGSSVCGQDLEIFAVLDKFSNLVCGLNKLEIEHEPSCFMALASTECKDFVTQIFSEYLGKKHEYFANILTSATEICYRGLHEKLKEQIPDGESEVKRLVWLRVLRNMNHGAFLNRSKFHDVYTANHASIPEDASLLPFLLAWALLIHPKGFIDCIGKIVSRRD